MERTMPELQMTSSIPAQGGYQVGYQNGYLASAFVVEEIARSLVDEPESVAVKAVRSETGTTLVLTVGPTDLGKVIGRQGRTVKSLRMILMAISKKAGRPILLEVRQGAQTLPCAVGDS